MILEYQQNLCFKLAEEKGWWQETTIDEALQHLKSEVGEARRCVCYDDIALRFGEDGKPEGLPAELADIVIMVMSICGMLGIDIAGAIKEKHEYNKRR